jgi:hypothetical protein
VIGDGAPGRLLTAAIISDAHSATPVAIDAIVPLRRPASLQASRTVSAIS